MVRARRIPLRWGYSDPVPRGWNGRMERNGCSDRSLTKSEAIQYPFPLVGTAAPMALDAFLPPLQHAQ